MEILYSTIFSCWALDCCWVNGWVSATLVYISLTQCVADKLVIITVEKRVNWLVIDLTRDESSRAQIDNIYFVSPSSEEGKWNTYQELSQGLKVSLYSCDVT